MHRRHLLAGSAALTLAARAVRAAGNPKLLKFIPQADIALLDPDFTPALVTRNHAYMVYDTLYGVDDALHPRPKMAAGHVIEDDGKTWKITLRDGLRFHDGSKILARDAVASLNRWAKRDVYAISVWTDVDELSAISDTTIQFRLKRPFRLLPDLLGKPNPFAPVVMPERLALTAPGQQVTEIIGSGPYKFSMPERIPGSLAVYLRNADYVPRTDGPPFDSAGIRRALLGAFSQTDMMTAVAGDDHSMWRSGVGFFQPNSPCASDAGMEKLNSPRDLAQVKRDLAAAGYNGEKFVFLVPTDLPAINAMSEVAADIFRKLGMNMDYQTLDWATVAQRLNSQEPLDKGGWSLNANYAPGYAASSPAAHGFLRGLGRKSLFGWPTMPKLEALRGAWIDSTDPDEQKRLCREIQLQAFQDVPYIPLGAFFFASAYRSDLTGMLKGSVPMFTNLRRT